MLRTCDCGGGSKSKRYRAPKSPGAKLLSHTLPPVRREWRDVSPRTNIAAQAFGASGSRCDTSPPEIPKVHDKRVVVRAAFRIPYSDPRDAIIPRPRRALIRHHRDSVGTTPSRREPWDGQSRPGSRLSLYWTAYRRGC